MTFNDVEWPFYVKFSLLRTAIFYILAAESVTHMTEELV